MAFNSVRLACLVSDDLSTYEVEEVAEGTSMAVVGEMRGNIIQSLSGGANPHWHLVFLELSGCFSVAIRSRQWKVLSVWYPQQDNDPVLSTYGMMRQRFLARNILFVRRGRPHFLG